MKDQIIKSVTKSVKREVTKNMSSVFAAAFTTDDSVINNDCSQDLIKRSIRYRNTVCSNDNILAILIADQAFNSNI